MGLSDIQARAEKGGYRALNATERYVAFQHGWLSAWCNACGRPWRFGQSWHFPIGGLKRRCLGTLTYEEKK